MPRCGRGPSIAPKEYSKEKKIPSGGSGRAPGLGGLPARNIQESYEVRMKEAIDYRTPVEKVWENIRYVKCQEHDHPDPVIIPQTTASWKPPLSKNYFKVKVFFCISKFLVFSNNDSSWASSSGS